jgi:hypothetical protein
MIHAARLLPAIFSLGLALAPLLVSAQGATDTATLTDLQKQNQLLQQTVQQQQRQLDDLRARLDAMQAAPAGESTSRSSSPALTAKHSIRLSGEFGAAFFHSGPDGGMPNAEFRIDDAKIFIESPVWKNVYVFAGLDLSIREDYGSPPAVGEFYLDAEDVWTAGRKNTLNLRIGRFYTPFGEEYQERGVITNPLITHTLADIWGIDQGVEAYGSLGGLNYAIAVQNGGPKTSGRLNSDKAVALRLAVDPSPRLHLSASAMRTGELDASDLSELWFANTFFRSIGPTATTRTFSADLVELDAAWRWSKGHLKAAAGRVNYDDDSTTADYSRQIDYHNFELKQAFGANFFGAARYSAIRAPKGYPLAGLGEVGKYFFNPFGPRTTRLERLSLGVGYQFAPPLVWKLEYSWETGRLTTGAKRNDEDMFSSLLGVKF